MRKNLGWLPDLPDMRDWYYDDVHSPLAVARKLGIIVNPNIITEPVVPNPSVTPSLVGIGPDGLPSAISLRDRMPAIFDQQTLGACVAHSSAAMFQFVHQAILPEHNYSRLQIYYNAREMESTIPFDAGCMNRDAIQVLANIGAGPESDWPYIESNFAIAPPPKEILEANVNKAVEYSRLITREDFRNCLAQQHPFITGITLFSSFESNEVAKTGVVPMPKQGESMLGGHSVCIIGYDNNYKGMGEYYEMRNSWNEGWGDFGHAWLPAAYLEPTGNNQNLASDCWSVRL